MATITVSLPVDDSTAEVADYNTPITTIVNEINGGLDSNNLADNAVTTSKITDANVTTAKIADANVTVPKLSNPYKAMAHITAASQSINDNTATEIAFDAEDYDTNNNFASNGYTAPVTGYYQVNCNAQLADATGKLVSAKVQLYVDSTGMTLAAQTPYPGISTAGAFNCCISQVVYLTANQKVTFKATVDTSDSGAAEITGGTSGTYCSFHLLSV